MKTQVELLREIADQERIERERRNKAWEEETKKTMIEVFGAEDDELDFLSFLYNANYEDDDEEEEDEEESLDWDKSHHSIDWYDYNGVSRNDFL